MTSTVTTACWEQCFQSVETTAERQLFEDLLKITYDLKKERDINGANALAVLLDSTLSPACHSSDSHESNDPYFNATLVWTMQLQLMAIIAGTVGSVLTFPVQFNENAAWSCQEYSCLSGCAVFSLAKGNYLSPLETNSSACRAGLLEPACRLAFNGISNYTCSGTVTNNMTLAILNSNAHSHVNKEGNYADYSPCKTFFDYRLGVGLHNANRDDLNRFQSDRGFHVYLSDDNTSINLINKLFNCINSQCCTTGNNIKNFFATNHILTYDLSVFTIKNSSLH